MATVLADSKSTAASIGRLSASRAFGWFAAALGVGFVVPFVGVDLLRLQHDFYLLVYFTLVGAVAYGFVHDARFDVRRFLGRSWPWSVGIGIVMAAFTITNLLGDGSTSRPTGAYFWFEIAWRGVAYGVADAVLLWLLPGAIAFCLFDGRLGPAIARRAAFIAVALGLVLTITAVYHLGYPQYRNGDTSIGQPLAGGVAFGVPLYVVGNPLGALLAHPAMHVAAVLHEYEGETYLPPTVGSYEERWAGTTSWFFGIGWAAMALAVGLGLRRFTSRRRR